MEVDAQKPLRRRAPQKLEIPAKYKESDVLNIIKLLETRSPYDVIKIYGRSLSMFKKDITLFRKIGYKIPEISYKKDSGIFLRALVKKEPVALPRRVINESLLKWVRVDKRTLIQVDIKIDDSVAVEQYYIKREEMKKNANR